MKLPSLTPLRASLCSHSVWAVGGMAEHRMILHTTVVKAAQCLAWLSAQLTLDRLVLISLQLVECRVLATEPHVKFAHETSLHLQL